MRFWIRVPGSPPSWNHTYRIIRLPSGRHGLAKTAEGANYQLVVATLARQAKPTGWEPKGQLRVIYHLYLKRAMDADNVMKIINDGIATGLDVNDSRFLPCVEHLSTGNKFPRVEIEVVG